MGVQVENAEDFDFPLDVEIDAGGIGGPSAGLAFALDIVDELGDEDLSRGRTVVATGELDLDGNVHAIGGVKQKAIGARDAGADIFLVPDANFEEAAGRRRRAPGRRRLDLRRGAGRAARRVVCRRENAPPEPSGICVFFVTATLNRRGRPVRWTALGVWRNGGKSPAKTAIFARQRSAL